MTDNIGKAVAKKCFLIWYQCLTEKSRERQRDKQTDRETDREGKRDRKIKIFRERDGHRPDRVRQTDSHDLSDVI